MKSSKIWNLPSVPWQTRFATCRLAKLVAAPLSWDPTDVPLPRNAGLASRKRAFVLTFLGDAGRAQPLLRVLDLAQGEMLLVAEIRESDRSPRPEVESLHRAARRELEPRLGERRLLQGE